MSNYQNLTASQEIIIKHYLPENNSIEKLSLFYSAFSDITRLKILMSLCITPMCVGDLANVLNINQSTLSHQLQLLRNFGIVKAERNKKNITYSIFNEYVEKIIEFGVDASQVN